MTDNVAIRLPTVEGDILDKFIDKCEEVDADGRIIHSPFCGLSEKIAKGESVWGSYMDITMREKKKKQADLREAGLRIPMGFVEDE
jgi:hypothetical protein